ncbi:Proteophosphoglycan ppg4 [Mycena chlorophos]|uniref:Proteophosphoglycan ppg4 n=1 Tax=Mycena chlorophos TaxID=658473 RepID=A0A8H6WN45_MYCCL|nr:Proteophosphoglycan ppg4 [Mycena chlorophos]
MYISSRAPGGGNNGSGFPVSTWVPVAVVAGVLLILSLIICSRRLRGRLSTVGNAVAVASGTGPVVRELTAEQLVGSINQNPAAPPRRTRRPRRTPSQISTVSLPAYMKEPGEMELVVTRGPDGEDVAIPAATIHDDEHEEDHSNEGHAEDAGDNDNSDNPVAANRRRSTVDNSRYVPMPHSPHDSPLLGAQEDPRGVAPAYFEVVDEPYPPGISADAVPETAGSEPATVVAPTTQRRSGFFSMFRPAPAGAATSSIPLPTTSPEASRSNLSLTHTRTRSTTNGAGSPPPSSSRHRPSTSTSTLFSLGRKKSSQSLNGNNLTSPSLISLASISSPLPHTLVKTEFTSLPKAGLTPEQFKMISGSKDGGLNRFGVPFGEVAVRYAASASASRVALDETVQPPGWEEVAGPSNSGSHVDVEPETPSQLEVVVTVPSRAESRASGVSMQSFATAEDGGPAMAIGSDSEDDAEDEAETEAEAETAPTTPVLHVQEPTDATVRPAASSP